MIMHKYALIISIFIALTINAEASDITKMKKCTDLVGQRTAALTVRDWNNLERLAQIYIVDCKDVVEDEFLSYAYMDIGNALLQKGRYKDAIKAADAGIDLKYDIPGNHLIKAQAYIKMNDRQNAIENLNKSEKITLFAIEKDRDELKRNTDDSTRQMISSRINYLNSTLEFIRELKNNI